MTLDDQIYESIATALDDISCELMTAGLYETIVRSLASELAETGLNFDAHGFLKRCGVIKQETTA